MKKLALALALCLALSACGGAASSSMSTSAPLSEVVSESAPAESVSAVSEEPQTLKDVVTAAYAEIGIDIGNLAMQIDDWAEGERFSLVFNGKTYIAYCKDGSVAHIRCQDEGNEAYYENGEVLKYADPQAAIDSIEMPVLPVSYGDLQSALQDYSLPEFATSPYMYGGQLVSTQNDTYSITLTTDDAGSISSAVFYSLSGETQLLHDAALALAGEDAAQWVDENSGGENELEGDAWTLNLYQGNSGPTLEVYAPGYVEYVAEIMSLT